MRGRARRSDQAERRSREEELVASFLGASLGEPLGIRVVDESQSQEGNGQMRRQAEAGIAAGPLVHHVPRNGGNVLGAEPFETGEMQPGMLGDPWHPLRVRLTELLVATSHHHRVARLLLHPRAPLRLVQLARGHGMPHRHVALLASRRDVEEDAARGDAALEDGIDGAPPGALYAQALCERPAVVELAVPSHVAEGVHVGDPIPVIDHVESVEDHVHALSLGGEGHVVHVHGARHHVAREGHRAALRDEPLRLRLLGRGDEVHGAELVVVTPAPPVVQLLEVPFDAIAGGKSGIGHEGSFPEELSRYAGYPVSDGDGCASMRPAARVPWPAR